jgi:hypothetical protein
MHIGGKDNDNALVIYRFSGFRRDASIMLEIDLGRTRNVSISTRLGSGHMGYHENIIIK